MYTNKTIARIVGLLFLAGMVIGIIGNIIIQQVFGGPDYLSLIPSNCLVISIGAVLMLLTVAGDAAHGILMFPILKQHSERFAVGYAAFRIMDALFIAVQILLILTQIPLGSEAVTAVGESTNHLKNLSAIFIQTNQFAYYMAMSFLGVAGLILCRTLYSAKLVPKAIAIWGLAGYAIILCGSVLEILGFNLNFMETIPGGLWEVFIGVWLIVRGFKTTNEVVKQ